MMRIELRKLWLSAKFGINPLEEKTGIYLPNCVCFAKLEVCTTVLLIIQFFGVWRCVDVSKNFITSIFRVKHSKLFDPQFEDTKIHRNFRYHSSTHSTSHTRTPGSYLYSDKWPTLRLAIPELVKEWSVFVGLKHFEGLSYKIVPRKWYIF
jgi:hypothetical protein